MQRAPDTALHTADARLSAAAAVPRIRDEASWDYYAATDVEQFGDQREPGSKFLAEDLRAVDDIVALAVRQRRDLKGDDRDHFIARGAKPSAFRERDRYLLGETPGTVGVIQSADFPDATLLSVVCTKPGAPCSLVMSVDGQPATDYDVIVIAEDQQTGEDLVITTFPGIVTQALDNRIMKSLEGGARTVAPDRDILGKDFWANTRVESRACVSY